MKEQFDFPAFTGYRIEDNIVHIAFKKINELKASDVAEVFECFEKCGAENGVYVMITFNGYIPLSDEAMGEAKGNKAQKNVRANAFIVKSFALRIGIKFFMNFYKPKHSIYICGEKPEALAWLKQERKKNMKKEAVLV